jgi:hypothetical protein
VEITYWLIDNTVLSNFALIDKVALLKDFLQSKSYCKFFRDDLTLRHSSASENPDNLLV